MKLSILVAGLLTACGFALMGISQSTSNAMPSMSAMPTGTVSLALNDPATPAAPSTQPAAAQKPVNKQCAVMPEDPIDPSVTYLHTKPDGTKVLVGFCCEGCIDEFKSDPEKYLKTMK